MGRERAIIRRRNVELEISLDHLLTDYRQGNKTVTFMQIGANDGMMHDPIYPLVAKHNLRGVLVEPQRSSFAQLKKNYEPFGHNGFVFVNAALADLDGTRALYQIKPDPTVPGWARGIASFDKEFLKAHCAWWAQTTKQDLEPLICSEDVTTLTFNTLFARHDVGHIDLLQIDAEGYDGKILRMFDVPTRKPAIIRFERKHLTRDDRTYCFNMLADEGYKIAFCGIDALAYNPHF